MVCLGNGCQPLVVRDDGVEVVAQDQRGGEVDRVQRSQRAIRKPACGLDEAWSHADSADSGQQEIGPSKHGRILALHGATGLHGEQAAGHRGRCGPLCEVLAERVALLSDPTNGGVQARPEHRSLWQCC